MNEAENQIYKKRWIILCTVLSSTFMSTLDGSIVNVALPDMKLKLHTSMASVEWVVTSFLITIVAAILVFGRLGDIKGKTRVFRYGVVLFTIGSFLCGLTDSLVVLVAARVIQGIGAAATMANNQGIITQVFPANERGRALGVLGTFVALGAMAGPPIGGLIVSAMNWKFIFFINVPVGIIVFILSLKVFPKPTVIVNEKMDKVGAVLFGAAISLLFGAVVEGQSIGYNNVYIITAFIVSIIALIAFVKIESKMEYPLLYLKIFKNSLFSISIVCGFITFIAISASNIILPFYFEDALKLSASKAGLFMMVSPIVLAVVAPASGHISDKIGSEILTIVGLTITSLGFFLIGSLNEKSVAFVLISYIVIMSIGNGIFQAPNNSLIMSTAPKDKLGIAGSVNALVRNLAMVVGTSVATFILYNKMSEKAGHRVIDYVKGKDYIFIYGMNYVYNCAAILCLIGLAITVFRFFYCKKSKGKSSDLEVEKVG